MLDDYLDYSDQELKDLKSIAEDTRSFANSTLAKWILKLVQACENET